MGYKPRIMTTEHPLRAWRKRHGITLEMLATRVGVKASHLSMIECDLKSPSIELGGKLSRETVNDDGLPEVLIDAFDRPRAATSESAAAG